MLENIFILPLEYVAKILYLKIYSLISNYGISLFILSIISNIFMIALMRLVSRFSDRESKMQEILIPQIQKIKSESKGEKRHRRISTLYKRYSYHPIMGMRSAVPVLAQLPFLFAAYVMLNNLEAIKGVSFLLVANLGEPDAILAGIHILPLLMTIVNIATALVTKEFSLREKLQANFIAVFFLVLLYNASSALIIFWTTNNLLLLIRTLTKHFTEKETKL